MVSRDFIVKNSVHEISSVSHMWITSGLVCGLVGQQVWPYIDTPCSMEYLWCDLLSILFPREDLLVMIVTSYDQHRTKQ